MAWKSPKKKKITGQKHKTCNICGFYYPESWLNENNVCINCQSPPSHKDYMENK